MPDRLCLTIANALGLSPEEVSDTTSRDTCTIWDSLHHFLVVLAVEQEYGVRLSSTRIPDLVGVAAIREAIDGIEARRA